VHGLERIGTQVLLAFMRSLLGRPSWDKGLQHQLEGIRLVFMPLVNPGGMRQRTRCNPRGVDLMRNAPVDAREKVPFLLGGQRWTRRLPWYRGEAGTAMEPESEALAQVVRTELLTSDFSLALDCHSGFGLRDRIWFPYAHSRQPFAQLAEIHALKALFDQTYPHHPYLFEPQSRQYLTHGDLWDYLCESSHLRPGQVFLALTLELGSWLWIKKNPRQLMTLTGMFNPLVPHRQQRVLRGLLIWLDFLTRAAAAHVHWLPTDEHRDRHYRAGFAGWYGKVAP
jgi:hypothetical protein